MAPRATTLRISAPRPAPDVSSDRRVIDRFRAILNSSQDGICAIDRRYRFTYFNEHAQACFQADAASLIGKPILSAFPRASGTEIARCSRRVMRSGKAETIDTFFPDTGSWYEVDVAPTPEGLVIFFRNVDDRKKAEDALIERGDQALSILDSVPQTIFSCNALGLCHYLSPQWSEFTGRSLEEGLGRGWLKVVHPDDVARVGRGWSEAVRQGLSFRSAYRCRHRSGESRWMELTLPPRRNDQGQIEDSFGNCADDNDRVLAQTSL